jgi:hypothetical protein
MYDYPDYRWTIFTLGRQGRHLGNCKALLEQGADQGDYYACLMSKDLADLPESAARVFHPNVIGMAVYRDAIVEAYNYKPCS